MMGPRSSECEAVKSLAARMMRAKPYMARRFRKALANEVQEKDHFGALVPSHAASRSTASALHQSDTVLAVTAETAKIFPVLLR